MTLSANTEASTARTQQHAAPQLGRDAYLHTAPLQPGDTVALISPAGRGTQEALNAALKYLKEWGLNVLLGENLFASHPRATYLAGTDEQRRNDLFAAWTCPDVDAVICARGGYGAMRLLDEIDWENMRRHALRKDGRPKLLTGSSDITALHEAWRENIGVPTLFCPMVTNDVFLTSEFIREDVHRWLFESWAGRELIGPNTETLVPGSFTGNFTGGNLSLLAAGIGSPEAARLPEGILFLEDIDEDTYRIDNLLLQLKRSGRLAAAGAIVLGSWHNCDEMPKIKALLSEYTLDLGVPVLWEQGFGHDPNALSIPLNVPGTLTATADSQALTVASEL